MNCRSEGTLWRQYAVGERDFECLDEGLMPAQRVLRQKLGWKDFQNVEGLDDRSAAAGPRNSQHLVTSVGGAEGCDLFDSEPAEIRFADESSILDHVCMNLVANLSSIKRGNPVARQLAKGPGQIGAADDIAHLTESLAVGECEESEIAGGHEVLVIDVAPHDLDGAQPVAALGHLDGWAQQIRHRQGSIP
jgi:hypothetical protein